MIRHIILIFSILMALCLPALAQPVVNVRTGEHSGYTRAVFDWGYDVPYEVQQTGPGHVLVTFHGAADMKLAGKVHGPDILGIKQISTDGTNLQVVIRTPADRTFKDFKTAGCETIAAAA